MANGDPASPYYSQGELEEIAALQRARRKGVAKTLGRSLIGALGGAAGTDLGALQAMTAGMTTRVGQRPGTLTQEQAETLALKMRQLQGEGNATLIDLQKALESGEGVRIKAALGAFNDSMKEWIDLAGTATTATAGSVGQVNSARVNKMYDFSKAMLTTSAGAYLEGLSPEEQGKLLSEARTVDEAMRVGVGQEKQFDKSVGAAFLDTIQDLPSDLQSRYFAYVDTVKPGFFDALRGDGTGVLADRIDALDKTANLLVTSDAAVAAGLHQAGAATKRVADTIRGGGNIAGELQKISAWYAQTFPGLPSPFQAIDPETAAKVIRDIQEDTGPLEDNPLFGLVSGAGEDLSAKIESLEQYSEDVGETEARATRGRIGRSEAFQEFQEEAQTGAGDQGFSPEHALREYIRGGKKALKRAAPGTREAVRSALASREAFDPTAPIPPEEDVSVEEEEPEIPVPAPVPIP